MTVVEPIAAGDRQAGLALRVQGLSKIYQMYDSPRARLIQSLFPQGSAHQSGFSALKGVSFDVRRGETLGIVGRNGSGKSTLLQILCGTLQASAGTVATAGRISALLELGAGFDPECTGRENILLNAALLGLSPRETLGRFDEILKFSELSAFVDRPVKTYSSGMYVRLAFAVAIHTDPEILVVDEALAVGDEAFQRKCYSRIRAMQEAGTTIIFVSHAADKVIELCDRAILLDRGELILAGTPKEVVSQYHKLLHCPADRYESLRTQMLESDRGGTGAWVQAPFPELPASPPAQERSAGYDPQLEPKSTICYPSRGAEIRDYWIQDEEGRRVNLLLSGRTYVLRYDVYFAVAVEHVRFGMLLKTVSGFELGGGASAASWRGIAEVHPGYKARVDFQFQCNLNEGVFFANTGVLGVIKGKEEYLDRRVDALMFRVLPADGSFSNGLVDFKIEPAVDLTPSDPPGNGEAEP